MSFKILILSVINIIIIIFAIKYINYLRNYEEIISEIEIIPSCTGNSVLDLETNECIPCPNTTWKYGTGEESEVKGCRCLNNKLKYNNGVCSCELGYNTTPLTQFNNLDGTSTSLNNCEVQCKYGSNRTNNGASTNTVDCKCNQNTFDPMIKVCIGAFPKFYYLVSRTTNDNFYHYTGEMCANTNFLNTIVNKTDQVPFENMNFNSYYNFQVKNMDLHFGEDTYIYSFENQYAGTLHNPGAYYYYAPEFQNRLVKSNEILSIFNFYSREGIAENYDISGFINCTLKIKFNYNYNESSHKPYILLKYSYPSTSNRPMSSTYCTMLLKLPIERSIMQIHFRTTT